MQQAVPCGEHDKSPMRSPLDASLHRLPLPIHTFRAEHSRQSPSPKLARNRNGLVSLEDVDPAQLVVRPCATNERALAGVLRLHTAAELLTACLEPHLS